ncbi:hypothetical protein Bca4012_067315 [Brassica carinata]
MNNPTILMLIIFMCSVLKESYGCAPNILEFNNNIFTGQVIQVNCTSNRNEIKGIQTIEYTHTYSFPVSEKGKGRIVWRCHVRWKNKFSTIWRAYRGAARTRCGQIRFYRVALERIYFFRNNKATTQFFDWHE